MVIIRYNYVEIKISCPSVTLWRPVDTSFAVIEPPSNEVLSLHNGLNFYLLDYYAITMFNRRNPSCQRTLKYWPNGQY